MQSNPPMIKVNKINNLEAGKRIRTARVKSGKSLRWLANKMGFTAPFMSDLELGRRNWTMEKFECATDILNDLHDLHKS